jgi:hexosaminidase
MFAAMLLSAIHVLPRPRSVEVMACPLRGALIPRSSANGTDPGALDELNRRWKALGIGRVRIGADAQLVFTRDPALKPQAYRLTTGPDGVRIASSDAAGAFYGVMTLAQLPVRQGTRWYLPCVRISDRPALRWRILSDDISRGPIPTMRYFERRIRTIAAFKMNGYSPYMESVFVSPTDPLPAPLDGITPSQLRTLDRYAARYHVSLIPEQQTFAHMHGTLRIEKYASAAAFPHGFLLSPASRIAQAYLARIISQELQAVPHPPFFHIGSDETSMLGEGATRQYVREHGGVAAVYARHVTAMAKLIAPSGARVMLWDDGIQKDPSIMAHIPKDAVVVNWHYGAQKSYMGYIRTIARGGLQQMVAPGADNWDEIFPNAHNAIADERTFIGEGKSAHVLGLFQTVWNDDGETLFGATWYPVLYAACDAWSLHESPRSFLADFPSAFFGIDQNMYARDEEILGSLDAGLGGDTDKLFWADPFDPVAAARMSKVNLRAIRLAAERVETDLFAAHPPLHAGAAAVMLLAARRYDALGRRYQIAQEIHYYYDHARTHPQDAVRDLFWCKYWFWEQRDSDESLAPQYAALWRQEDRPGHLADNLERYHLDAQLAIRRADAIDRVTYDDYLVTKTLPPLLTVLHVR